MAKGREQNTWVLLVSAVGALALVAGVVALDRISTPLDGVIRVGALLGYLTVFIAALSSNFMRELTRFFGRPFPKIHHYVSVTALISLSVHAISVAWRSGTASVFIPAFSSLRLFFSLGGRPAFWLIAITSLTALLRASIGKNWKIIHWLNYVAFFLGTAHAQLIGPNFQHLGVRIVSIAMAVALVVVFVLKRTARQRRQRQRRSK
jgi:DMSO/TMAO reductase YedYZ heme-binding membrane subunit